MNTETETPAENVSSPTPKKKKPAKKAAPKKAGKSAKQKLAEGAAKIRKAQAEAKKKPAKKPAKKDGGELEIFAPFPESKDDIATILSRCVHINKDNTAATVAKDTTRGEYIRIFDYVRHQAEFAPLILGDIINAAPAVFGTKYAAALASTGRSIDTLKAYASAARHIPAAQRNAHPAITYTHLRELVKVPELEDKKAIIADAVKSAKDGHPLTVKDFRAKADKFKPRKKKKAKAKKEKAEVITMNAVEREHFGDMLDAASKLEHLIGGGAYALDISSAEKLPLREKLDAIARFAAQLRD